MLRHEFFWTICPEIPGARFAPELWDLDRSYGQRGDQLAQVFEPDLSIKIAPDVAQVKKRASETTCYPTSKAGWRAMVSAHSALSSIPCMSSSEKPKW
jgi:hypothetical protein